MGFKVWTSIEGFESSASSDIPKPPSGIPVLGIRVEGLGCKVWGSHQESLKGGSESPLRDSWCTGYGLELRVSGLGFRVEVLGCGVRRTLRYTLPGFLVYDVAFRVWGSGFRI